MRILLEAVTRFPHEDYTQEGGSQRGTRRIEEVVYKEETLVLESVQDKRNILTFHRQIT